MCPSEILMVLYMVALLAEGVDRNFGFYCLQSDAATSLSSRRAWIEISYIADTLAACALVALLAEGVDRNIGAVDIPLDGVGVALLAEGVDRNTLIIHGHIAIKSRSPRGGRG